MKRKMGKWFVLVLMATVMLSLSSCGSSNEDDLLGMIELNNSSVVTIDGFYLAPVNQISWGPNILGGLLYPGQYTSIVDIYPGYYDARIRAAGAYSDYFGYLYDIHMAAGEYLPMHVYNSDFSGSLEIRNNDLGASIVGVYVVPANAPTWGANLISSAIGPLGSRQIIDITPGLHDVKLVWNAGPDSIYYDIRIDSLTLITINAD